MDTSRWTPERAQAWQAARPWRLGCNFLPSTAVNPIAMWDATTFDAPTIARELAWGASLGLNAIRVFLNHVVWADDAAGLRQRFAQLLDLAAAQGMGVMPILFDDCAFSGRTPIAGPQPPPVPGVHNSGWVPSQPLAHVDDPQAWPQLEAYVTDLVRTFAADPRIDAWDIYNEPGNSGLGERSLGLLEHAFAWARAAQPSQPLTAGLWKDDLTALVAASLAHSDVLSIHLYDTEERCRAALDRLPTNRPLLITEWMGRQRGSTFFTHLDLWRRRSAGCWCWGLVNGATQTHFPWGSPPGAAEPDLWFHDLLHRDGTPWCPEEAAFLRRFAAASAVNAVNQR